MTTKFKRKNRFLSLLLALVLAFGMVPVTGVSVSAAPSEASEIKTRFDLTNGDEITYSNGATAYYKYNNYLYKMVFSNMNNISSVNFGKSSDSTSATVCVRMRTNNGELLSISVATSPRGQSLQLKQFPTQAGESVKLYAAVAKSYYDINKVLVTFTCMGVGTPTWTWNDTSSATAKFTSTDNGATLTVGAKISSALSSTHFIGKSPILVPLKVS